VVSVANTFVLVHKLAACTLPIIKTLSLSLSQIVSHASLHQTAMHPTHQNSISVFLCACLFLYLSRQWFLLLH
jgi:hypothetical protein